MNIGITLQIDEKNFSVWSNGIRQNVFFFAQALMNLKKHNVYVVLVENDLNIPINDNLMTYINHYKIVKFKDIKNKLDMLFIMGSAIRDEDGLFLKKKGCKIVYYNCGNQYMFDAENILFKDGEGILPYKLFIDEVWMIPQMENTSYYYFETLYKVKVKVVPFVWNTIFVDKDAVQLPNNARYAPSTSPKKISCFEPNINLMKYSMYPILITERAYIKRPDLIKHLYVASSAHLKDKPKFVSIMSNLEIVKKGIATFETRFPMPWFLSEHTDIVVAHQLENPLNYAYLDAIYLGYPLVHNSHMIKDCGYYYEEFNAEQGAEQLLYALTEHDKHIEEYNEKTQKILDRYLPTNKNTLDTYDKLITELYEKQSLL